MAGNWSWIGPQVMGKVLQSQILPCIEPPGLPHLAFSSLSSVRTGAKREKTDEKNGRVLQEQSERQVKKETIQKLNRQRWIL